MHTHLDIEPIHNCFQWIVFSLFLPLVNLATIMNAISPLAVYESSDALSVFGRLSYRAASYLDDHATEDGTLCDQKTRGIIKKE
jgi:hypothetical protein